MSMNDYNYYRISNIEITSKSKKKLLLWKYCILYDKWVCMMDMFVDAWEQRKLPEFVSFFNGLTYTPDDVQETGTLVLRSSNVKNGEIVDADNVYVSDEVVTSERRRHHCSCEKWFSCSYRKTRTNKGFYAKYSNWSIYEWNTFGAFFFCKCLA